MPRLHRAPVRRPARASPGRAADAMPAGAAAPVTAAVDLFLNAVAAERAGRTGEAEIRFRAAVEAWPRSAAAWRGLAVVQHRLGRSSEAADSMRKARALDAVASASVAATLLFHGDDRRAHRLLMRALAADPGCLKAHWLMGNLRARLGDREGSVAH
ncbi:MAG: tetratricopeptide repeat protein [Alphaproteobacteria bacterium]|nr:tetratricopeptide repeat protein [Alphaproteobacteria bacterium]